MKLTEEYLLKAGAVKVAGHYELNGIEIEPAGDKFRIGVNLMLVYIDTVDELETVLFGLSGQSMSNKKPDIMDEVTVKRNTAVFKAGEKVTIISITPSIVQLYLCQNKDGLLMTLTQNDFIVSS